MGNVGRRIRLTAAAALVVVTMSGCAIWDRAIPSPAPVSEAPEPTPSADPVVGSPTPRLAAGCDDLIPLDTLMSALAEGVAFDAERSRARSPEDAAVEQLGGLRCVWANRAPGPPWEDQDPDYVSALLQVVPDGEVPWRRFVEVYGPMAEPSPYGNTAIGPNCHGAEPDMPLPSVHSCQLDALVGSYWVQFSMTGVGGGTAQSNEELLAHARGVTDPLMATLASQEPPTPRWSPPPSQPLDCQAVLSDEQAITVTGVPGLVVGQYFDGPRVGQLTYSLDETESKRCHLLISGSDQTVGQVSFLPGGGWAFRDRSDSWVDGGNARSVNIAGARSGEGFTEECGNVEADCRIDMLVGENWLQVMTYAYVPGKIATPEGVDMLYVRSQTRALAETVLANLHASE
jgi:hypothetical protein